MKSALVIPFIILFFGMVLISCKSNTKRGCRYQYESLIDDTSNHMIIEQDDSIIQVMDNTKDSNFSKGVYTFDKNRVLRFYAFLVNKNQYHYAEEYDKNGNLISKKGSPLVEYRIYKSNNDSILFNVFLFSLNKRYENIEIVSNYDHAVTPQYLFKSEYYSNVKCFAFKLKAVSNIHDLVLFTKGTIVNTCNQEKYLFRDTTTFSSTIIDTWGNVSN